MSVRVAWLSVVCAAALSASAGEVNLVGVGWSQPSLASLKANPKAYEEAAPFDGLVLSLGSAADVFKPEGFSGSEKARIQADAKLVKDIRFKRWKHNFLNVMIDRRSPDWFNEAAWRNILENWRTVAKAAKAAGMVGLRLDTECYAVYPANSYWRSDWWLKGDKDHAPDRAHDAAAYRAQARERGRAVGKAVFKEFPEAILWGYYLWSFKADLLGEFCNGVLEELPKGARLVDGDEWNGYCAKGEGDYARMKARNEDGYGLVDRKLVGKNRQQGGVAPAFYLDAYATPEKSGCLTPTINAAKSKARFFKDNLTAAKRAASAGFVWIYGEKGTWWPELKSVPWEEQVPGITEALFGDRLDRKSAAKMKKGAKTR